jgi:hypothetical protein
LGKKRDFTSFFWSEHAILGHFYIFFAVFGHFRDIFAKPGTEAWGRFLFICNKFDVFERAWAWGCFVTND